jgi:hypothetical protein
MNSAALSPSEFWFYRVYSELTLSFLHQLNNELTGVVFLTELIQNDMESGTPAGDKFQDLHASIAKVIRLTQQTMDAHLPVPEEVWESPHDLGELLQEGIPMLRLVLSKAVAVRMDSPPAHFPRISIIQKDFRLVLAAVGLMFSPRSPGSRGELVITVESSPAAIIFHPSYLVADWTEGAVGHPESRSAFLALEHRLGRLGGRIEPCQPSPESSPGGLRLVFTSPPHEP